jgi:hypothetical protein
MKNKKSFKTDTIDRDGNVHLELLLAKFAKQIGRSPKASSINLNNPLVALEVIGDVLCEVERSIKQLEKFNLSCKRQIQKPVNLNS